MKYKQLINKNMFDEMNTLPLGKKAVGSGAERKVGQTRELTQV